LHIWQYVLDVRNPTTTMRRLTDRREPEYNGVFSPDGARVLFGAITLSGTQGNLDIAAVNKDGTGLKTVLDDGGKLVHQDWPAWSPNGRRFAFSSTHEGNQEIYTAAADGSDLIRLTQSPGVDTHPCWSPDGQKIAFATDRWGGLELASVRPDGTGLVRLTSSPGLDDYPAYSLDGSRLAFVSNRDHQFEVYVAAADGSNPFNLSRHPLRDTFPTWTPNGRGVTFVSNRDGGPEVYTQTLEP
jgi:TolB protein